jgi:16S rRNA (cytosine967-C5)-methyltransferase
VTRPGARRRPPPRPDPARSAAYQTVRAVSERDAYANLVLPRVLRDRGLAGRDAALATELAYGSLRAQGTLDLVLAGCVDRPLEKVDPPLRDLLRLGAYQLLSTRVPAHAAVATTVELTRAVMGEGPARYANAVLRRVSVDDRAGWLARVSPAYHDDPLGHLAVTHNHPRWVAQAFADALGGDLAATAALLAADDAPPAVHLVARPGRIDRAELLAAAGPGSAAGRWSPYAVHLGAGDPGGLEAVRDGRAGVQDEGSQLVAAALAGVALEGPDDRWLDLCAGPGGKAALLGGLARERDATVLAVELAVHRARLVAAAVAGEPVAQVVADGTVPAWRAASFDRVLLDAPCSGLGALRRRPESRWRRQPADLPRLVGLQRRLLTAALEAVRPGGVVGYATCSPHLAETRVVVEDVIRGDSDVQVLDARPQLPGVPDLGDGPYVQLWPHRHGTDAMFLAVLQRAAG